jgi:hypothetical protein
MRCEHGGRERGDEYATTRAQDRDGTSGVGTTQAGAAGDILTRVSAVGIVSAGHRFKVFMIFVFIESPARSNAAVAYL